MAAAGAGAAGWDPVFFAVGTACLVEAAAGFLARRWLDFRFSGIDPKLGWDHFVNTSMYAGSYLHSDNDRKAILRLTFDDWLILWVNGRKITAVRHDNGFETARIPIELKKGRNDLIVKTNNLGHCFNPWVANLVVEEP